MEKKNYKNKVLIVLGVIIVIVVGIFIYQNKKYRSKTYNKEIVKKIEELIDKKG